MNGRFPALLLVGALLTACAARETVTPASNAARTVTQSQLDSLPALAVTDGGRVCVANGRDLCPLEAGIANWIGDDRFAMWEPGRAIGAWKLGDTVPVAIGALGTKVGEYQNPSAIGGGSGSDLLVVDAQTQSLLRYDRNGKFLGSKALPKLFGITAWGFVGKYALLQRVFAKDSVTPATLEIKVLSSAGDTAGRVALTTTIPWLHLNDDAVSAALPLFPIQPVYAVAADGTLVWSAADRLTLQAVAPSGATRWSISSELTGPPIDTAQVRGRREALAQQAVPQIDLDSMTARTPATAAAITGILIDRDGRVMIGRATATASDSSQYLFFSRDGAPLARLSLGARVHPLLLTGDSLLVHRPTEGEPWEVRWLLLSKVP
ncbi:MAG: hypothetical protein ABJC19_04860 [Gemmatimonadota bacterium]